ncbi:MULTISPECIES: autotransporter outer membrane beta-barrel domain-containing protein [unclassified Pseudomonas]|uniref:autotransporter outer membrane beta-barrel domain-containing protein n=2 Tax=unclassified Pseudomonas TaxID=196821 RepID=UPI002B232D78|nr:autotransporter outer membrane beta-barrel domain-containing protein [Pseudomonas sp. RTB2]MEB0009862.1 autotransporter outer membrane beta-barrel domain-containing protein [Pseudomonas sp. RTB2]
MESSTARGDVKSFGGVVNINQSVVVSDREALTVIRGGNAISVANVSNSSLSGGVGANVGGRSELNVSNSQLAGVGGGSFGGLGVVLAGATVNASNGSLIVGSNNGLLISIDVGNATDVPKSINSVVVIDGSEVQGLNGPAIKVTATPPSMVSEPIGAVADITFQNHSTLLSGNGNLLEVDGDSTVKFTVDDSTLTGNLVADDTSTLNVTLQNNAQLTGDVINGNNLSINSGAQWQMVGDNAVKTLNLNGGGVNFGADGFHTLSLGELSGSGAFAMNIDLDAGVGDLLEVNGEANGDFTLKVKNTGVEPVSPDIQPLQVVHTEGGDAQFILLGNRVDLGVYSYELEEQGTDWFIVGSGKTISPSTQSVLALFNAAPNIWMSELSTLRSRMGEVRTSGEGGGWIRAYGNRFNATTGAGVDYEQRQSGMSFGADAPVPVSNGQLLIGLLGGYSKSDLDLSRGTSGNVDSYYVGAYGTWLSEEGYYVDGVLKLNTFNNESEVAMSDQTQAKGSYKNTGIGGSVEVGKHIKLADDFFLEPFAQMAAVVIQGDHYTLDNGLEAKNNRTQSVLGKVGTSVGRNIALKDGGVLQPYVRVAVAHEFARSNEVTVNDTRFNNELFGSRAELGAGVAVSLSKRLQVHADFDYMKGNNVEQPWGANVGVRFAF